MSEFISRNRPAYFPTTNNAPTDPVAKILGNGAAPATGDRKIDHPKWIHVVDSVPETAGMGVVVSNDDGVRILRRPARSSDYVVFQLRAGLIPRPSQGQPSLADNTQFWSELWGAGLTCGGAAVTGVGVAGALALAPETGGMSMGAAFALWGGLATSVAQCGVSLYRVNNVVKGHEDINEAWDHNRHYQIAMWVLDGVGLALGAGVLKEVYATHKALQGARAPWQQALAGNLNRRQRLAFTGAMEMHGVKRLQNVLISYMAKQRLLDLTAASLGILSSSTVDGSLIHDVAIWVVHQAAQS